MQPNEYMKLEHQLCFAFYTCSREMMKLYRPLLSPLGLTYTQYITLLSLWERDGVTVKELGAKLFLDSGTLTPLLKKLEAMGLITRTRDKEDERSVIIELTAKGQDLREQAAEVPTKLYAEMRMFGSKTFKRCMNIFNPSCGRWAKLPGEGKRNDERVSPDTARPLYFEKSCLRGIISGVTRNAFRLNKLVRILHNREVHPRKNGGMRHAGQP